LNEVLLTRNIQGIIVGPATQHYRIDGLDWNRFAATAIGYALVDPELHRVSEDHYKGMKLVFEHCLKEGYHRIGLGIVGTHNDERHQRWLAAFLLEQHLSGIEPKLPIFQAGSQDWQSAASDWAANHQPDIILTDYPDRWDISGIPTMGFAISDIENSQVQGIIENNREIGIGAADALVGLLYQNERGVPGCRRTILVDPREGFLAIP
jgi:LacI family transcriptional regulator